MQDKHFLICGATGYGLGACAANCVIDHLHDAGSLTIISRDLKNSIHYHTGVKMKGKAAKRGISFEWLNTGIAIEGPAFQSIIETLKKQKAKDVIIINTVAYAFSGVKPGFLPIYVKDIDDNGSLIQWKLNQLEGKQININRQVMGKTSIQLPMKIEKEDISVSASIFCDWRGSLDKISRIPEYPEYGRQGAYSTSVYIPKEIIQNHVKETLFTSSKVLMDAFFPIMNTPALQFLPGGRLIGKLMENIMKKNGCQKKRVSTLSLELLDCVGKNLKEKFLRPFPRFDCLESQFDILFFHVLEKLNNNTDDPFYYKKWIE